MSGLRRFYWLLVIATAANYGLMLFWAGPKLTAMSKTGGLPFDLRMFGYNHAEAREYVASLSQEGLEFYLQTAMLDTSFPAMFGLVLGMGGWLLLAHRPLILRIGMALIAACYTLFDYLENAAVARMISFDPAAETLPIALVATASRWTVMKFFFVDAALTVLLVLVLSNLITRLKESAA